VYAAHTTGNAPRRVRFHTMRNPTFIAVAVACLAATSLVAQAGEKPKEVPKEAKKKEPKPIDISKLRFISGCWRGRLDKDHMVEENWSSPSKNLFLATTRYLDRNNYATGFEFTRIEASDTLVVFAASSDGKPEDVYTMKTLVDEYVLFENPKKTFPQRIMYRMASDGALIPRNEGDAPSIELRMQRVKCPGADIKLQP
jgi:Domain of unknown function (DUF6265)